MYILINYQHYPEPPRCCTHQRNEHLVTLVHFLGPKVMMFLWFTCQAPSFCVPHLNHYSGCVQCRPRHILALNINQTERYTEVKQRSKVCVVTLSGLWLIRQAQT